MKFAFVIRDEKALIEKARKIKEENDEPVVIQKSKLDSLKKIEENQKRIKKEMAEKKKAEKQLFSVAKEEVDVELVRSNLDKIKLYFADSAKGNIWLFSYAENEPDSKVWALYKHINDNHKEVKICWLCQAKEQLDDLTEKGLMAVGLGSIEAASVLEKAGVYVSEKLDDVKLLDNTKYLFLGSNKDINSYGHLGKLIIASEICADNEYEWEKIFVETLQLELSNANKSTLYSFDVFDTLISRKGVEPVSIFYAVKERVIESGRYSEFFAKNYPKLRHDAEMAARRYKKVMNTEAEPVNVEIKMADIFDKMVESSMIDKSQAAELMEWEIEEEIASVLPIISQIDRVKELLEKGEKVILISDMYLPKEVIEKMLEKADPVLGTLPLYLSNEYGVLKNSGLLYKTVYREIMEPGAFTRWIHAGDNPNSDNRQAKNLGIETMPSSGPVFSHEEKKLTETFENFEGFLIAGMQNRLKAKNKYLKADFVIDFVAPIMVSYVDWACRDAINKGFTTLIFVSRDGHPLKKAADALIESNGWNLKTKYIYASRKTWRIPSYIEKIDDEFFADYGGNFNGIVDKENFLRAMDICEEDFVKFFPDINLDEIDFANRDNGVQPARLLVPVIKASEAYTDYLLKKAGKERELVCGYLKQEVSEDEKVAFVEFYGRGYNQLCHSRLWNEATGKKALTVYYYARSIMPTDGYCVRYNITCSDTELFFMEAIFANLPYESVERYEEKNGVIEPVLCTKKCDMDLFEAMENLLPEYAKEYSKLEIKDFYDTDKELFDFMIEYADRYKTTPFLYENLGELGDAISMYSDTRQYARPYTLEDIENFKNGGQRGFRTKSVAMSYMRSPVKVRQAYKELFQIYDDAKPEEGRKLSNAQVLSSRKLEKNYNELVERIDDLKRLYSADCLQEAVQEKILAIGRDKGKALEVLDCIRPLIENDLDYSIECIWNNEIESATLSLALATSKIVIIIDCAPRISNIRFREETTVLLLRTSAFSPFKLGRNLESRLHWRGIYNNLAFSQNVDLIETPGDMQKQLILSEGGYSDRSGEALKGSVVSDIYFNKEIGNEIRNLLEEQKPELQGKKLILLMTDLRTKDTTGKWLDIPDLRMLSEKLNDEYFVLMDFIKKIPEADDYFNEIIIPGFSAVLPEDISTRKAICASDIVIGNYREEFFETALTDKEVIAWMPDKADVLYTLNAACKYEDYDVFETAADTEKLAGMIVNPEDYSGRRREFVGKYLNYCDGHSIERLIEIIKNL